MRGGQRSVYALLPDKASIFIHFHECAFSPRPLFGRFGIDPLFPAANSKIGRRPPAFQVLAGARALGVAFERTRPYSAFAELTPALEAGYCP